MASTTAPASAGTIFTFKIDKDDLAQLTDAAKNPRTDLGGRLTTLATGAKAVVDVMQAKLSTFESGFLSARLAGTSVNNLRALESAGQELGVPAEAMRSSLQSLYRALRDGPEAARELARLNISTQDSDGKQRDTGEVFLALSDALKTMAPTQARDVGRALEIDPRAMEGLRAAEFTPLAQSMGDALADSKVGAAGERAHQLMATVRDLGRSADEMFSQALLTMAGKLEPLLTRFSEWFKENGATLGTRIGELGNAVSSVLLGLMPVLDLIMWLDRATGGWSTTLGMAAVGLLMLGGGGILTGLFSILSALSRVSGLSGLLAGVFSRLGSAIVSGVGSALSVVGQGLSRMGGWIVSASQSLQGAVTRMATAAWSSLSSLAARGVSMASSAVRQAGVMLSEVASSVWTRASGFFGQAIEKLGSLGARAVPLLSRVLGPLGLALYPSQLGNDQDELRKFERQQEEDRKNGVPPIWEREARQDMQNRADNVQRNLGIPAAPQALPLDGLQGSVSFNGAALDPWDRYRLGAPDWPVPSGPVEGASVALTATTNVYVNGSIDPAATGSAVASQQNRVFADMTRNLKGVYA